VELRINDVPGWMGDDRVLEAVIEVLAEIMDVVNFDWMLVTFQADYNASAPRVGSSDRRLLSNSSATQPALRRLMSSDIVLVNYVVTLPPDAVYTRPGVTSTSITNAIISVTMLELQTQIREKVAEAVGAGAYTVVVTSISLPRVVVQTLTATTTGNTTTEVTSTTTTTTRRIVVTGTSRRRTSLESFHIVTTIIAALFMASGAGRATWTS